MDLRTRYLGLDLRSPLVVSACTLSEEIDNILRMEDAGAGAVVLFSLFEEQIRLEEKHMENVLASTSNMFAEASDYFPQLEDYHVGTSRKGGSITPATSNKRVRTRWRSTFSTSRRTFG